jgi:hypothetical protein
VERRRQGARRTPPGGIAGSAAPAPRATGAPVSATSTALAHIQAIIDGGGQIMIGTIAPIEGAAVAHDGKKTLVMLRRRPRERIADLLARLDAAIATAQSTGSRVDEINTASSGTRYEI